MSLHTFLLIALLYAVICGVILWVASKMLP